MVLMPSKLVFKVCNLLGLRRHETVKIFRMTKDWESNNKLDCKPDTVVVATICHYFLMNGLPNISGNSFKSTHQICKSSFVSYNTIQCFLKRYDLLPK